MFLIQKRNSIARLIMGFGAEAKTHFPSPASYTVTAVGGLKGPLPVSLTPQTKIYLIISGHKAADNGVRRAKLVFDVPRFGIYPASLNKNVKKANQTAPRVH